MTTVNTLVDGTPEATDDIAKIMSKWEDEELSATSALSEDPEAEINALLNASDSDDEDELHRDVEVDDNTLDNIVLGVPDLAQAMDDFETIMGARPVMVVAHNGLGSKSARISFNQAVFLEIIGPDPNQADKPLHKKLATLPEGTFTPFHYAIRKSNAIDMQEKEFPAMGFDTDHITMYGRSGGAVWKWDEIFMTQHSEEGMVPFFIEWGSSEHACCKLPVLGDLVGVTVTAPSSSPVHKALAGVNGIAVEEGANNLKFEFATETGNHVFECSTPGGIAFPE